MEKKKIIIFVANGVVSSIFCSDKGYDVDIINWDHAYEIGYANEVKEQLEQAEATMKQIY